jgi:energy-coupling factor transport system ATP-binding protein
MQPRLLVLDEPTTDLDPRAKAELVEMLHTIGTETALLIVSHDLETIAPLVERLVIVDNGTIAADAPASELLASSAPLETHGIAVPQLAALNAGLSAQYADWQPASTVTDLVAELQARGVVPRQSAPPAPKLPRPGRPVIELEGVTFRYPGAGRAAVEDVSASIGQGELVAVVGNNGSGKTTLSKLILGLLKPTRGQVAVLGQAVHTIRPDQIGYIYQNPDAMLSQMSVRDEVAFTPRLLGRADWAAVTERMVQNFGLDQLERRFPLALSKGQRQRLAYAAVTAAGPPILIFDEPTTGIDQPGCDQIMQYMDSLRGEQKTIVFITHDMPLAMRWADRVLVMHDGHLVHSGPPASLTELEPARLADYHLTLPPVSEVARRLGLGGEVATPAALLASLERTVVACST